MYMITNGKQDSFIATDSHLRPNYATSRANFYTKTTQHTGLLLIVHAIIGIEQVAHIST